jgi:hypothetical protein
MTTNARLTSHHTSDITCNQTTVLVSLQRDQEIAPDQSLQLAQHIASCKACQAGKEQFNRLFAALDILLIREAVDG